MNDKSRPATFRKYLLSLAGQEVLIELSSQSDAPSGKLEVFDDYVSVEGKDIAIQVAHIVSVQPIPKRAKRAPSGLVDLSSRPEPLHAGEREKRR